MLLKIRQEFFSDLVSGHTKTLAQKSRTHMHPAAQRIDQNSLLFLKLQRNRVHTIPQTGRLRPVIEDVAEMSLTAGTFDLSADLAEATVFLLDHVLLECDPKEAWPAGF